MIIECECSRKRIFTAELRNDSIFNHMTALPLILSVNTDYPLSTTRGNSMQILLILASTLCAAKCKPSSGIEEPYCGVSVFGGNEWSVVNVRWSDACESSRGRFSGVLNCDLGVRVCRRHLQTLRH